MNPTVVAVPSTGSRTCRSGRCGGLAAASGTVVEPAGAGLMSSPPEVPAQVVRTVVDFPGKKEKESFDLGDVQGDQPKIVGW